MSPPDADRPPGDADPAFAEPWQARAFALATHLSERGAFPWPDFAAALAAEIARRPDGDHHAAWLAALEALVAARGLAAPETVAAAAQAWRDAARAAPHGAPVRPPTWDAT